MTGKEFEEIFEGRVKSMRETLLKKSAEYSRGGDRLSNFKRAAAMLGKTPTTALAGSWAKHLTSLLDMIDDYEAGTYWTWPVWEEKIVDAMNYLVLLEALVKEGIPYGTERAIGKRIEELKNPNSGLYDQSERGSPGPTDTAPLRR